MTNRLQFYSQMVNEIAKDYQQLPHLDIISINRRPTLQIPYTNSS